MSLNEYIENQKKPAPEHEVSLVDGLYFIRKTWITLALFGILGLICALIFLWRAPVQYEASALIQMAKISTPQNSFGGNIEEPSALIAKMGLVASYDEKVIAACGFELSTNGGDFSNNKAVKIAATKSSPPMMDLKVYRGTQELARMCAQSIFEQISASQDLLNYFSQKKTVEQRLIANQRLEENKQLIAKLTPSETKITPYYFDILKDIRALEDVQAEFDAVLRNNKFIPARLYHPIEVGSRPIYPKKIPSLVAGVLGGLLFGLLLAAGQHIFKSLRLELARNRT